MRAAFCATKISFVVPGTKRISVKPVALLPGPTAFTSPVIGAA